MAARVALSIVAVAAIAWLAVIERDGRWRRGGAATLSKMALSDRRACETAGASARTAVCRRYQRAVEQLRASRVANPDTAPELSLAILTHSDPRARIRAVEDVTRRDSENLAAWIALSYVSRSGGDWAVAARAAGRSPVCIRCRRGDRQGTAVRPRFRACRSAARPGRRRRRSRVFRHGQPECGVAQVARGPASRRGRHHGMRIAAGGPARRCPGSQLDPGGLTGTTTG